MAAIQFYHLLTTPMERALPKLLEKAHGTGARLLVVAGNEERVDYLNNLLWSYDPGSFLPHGSNKDGHDEQQPIYLSTEAKAPNQARMLLTTNGIVPDSPEDFDRILDMFDGNDPEALTRARQRWTLYKNNGHSVTYMKQTQNGGWEKQGA